VVPGKDFDLHLLLSHAEIDTAAFPLRPINEVRLEVPASPGSRQYLAYKFSGGDFMIELLFFLFSAIALGAAINVIVQKHVLYGALSFIVLLVAMSGLFILLEADFLAVINVIVYAGAIMVLFVFVIMLLNLPSDEDGRDRLRWLKFLGIPMGLFLLFMIVATVGHAGLDVVAGRQIIGSPEAIGRSLFTDFLLPFEVTSLLILIALMGAVVFAKKDQ